MASKRKILKYTGIGLLVLLGIILIFLPTLVKNYAINNSEELMGRQIDMGKLKFNYFTGTATVYDFKMFEANDTDVFTSFDTLIVNTVPYKYISNIKALDRFYLQGLTVNVIKNREAYNFDDLGERFLSGSKKDSVEDREAFKKFVFEQVGSADSLGLEKSLRQVSANQGMDVVAEEYINTMISQVDSYLKSKQPGTGIVVQKTKVSYKDIVEAARVLDSRK